MSYTFYPYSTSQAVPLHYPCGDFTFPHTQNYVFASPSDIPNSVVSVPQYPALPPPPASEWTVARSVSSSANFTEKIYPHHSSRGSVPYPYPMTSNSSHTAHFMGPVRSHKPTQRVPSKCKGSISDVDFKDTPPKVPAISRKDQKRLHKTALPGILIPQADCFPPRKDYAGPVYHPIAFNQIFTNSHVESYARVDAVLGNQIELLCPEDKVMSGMSERQIKVGLSWPGYSRYRRTKVIETERGQANRTQMFFCVAGVVCDFFREMQESKRYKNIEPGYEEWTIIKRPDGKKGIKVEDVVITSLVHRSGAEWQVELRLF